MKNTYVVCYGTLHVYKNKEDAIKEYTQDCSYCDPASSEFSRYASVVIDLLSGNIGYDNYTNVITEVWYQDTDKRIKLQQRTTYKKIIDKIENGEEVK